MKSRSPSTQVASFFHSLILATGLFGTPLAFAMPAQILLIRHAEKPDVGDHLSNKGRERAEKLIEFIKSNPRVNAFGKLAAIYAMAPEDEDHSVRAIETTEPAAKTLGIPFNQDYKKKKIQKLAKDIKGNASLDGKTVLICWENRMIPQIAKKLGLKDGPKNWDGKNVFDRIWVLTYKKDGAVTYENIGMNLLPGDRP